MPSQNATGASTWQREQEGRLLAEYALTRDPKVKARLVEIFTPFARTLAGRYRGGKEESEDLLQIAIVGLLNAIDRYSPERGRFKSFAAPTILGELRHHMRDRSWPMRMPRRLQEQMMLVNTIGADLADELGREPRIREVAERSGLDLEAVSEALEARDARRQSSLDAPLGDEESTTLGEVVGRIETGYERVESSISATSVALTSREKRVLMMYFGEGLRQDEIGGRLGISQMQVSRISRGAVRKLLGAVSGETAEGTPEHPVAA